jgi:DNA-binding winged helix-turn-helix (wHTH) protein
MGFAAYHMRGRFGEFTLDADLRRLCGRSGEIHLSPKAFDLLLLLVENRSRVMSKGELQRRLWPDTFVVDTNLASLIAEIREALEDDAKEPRFVRTAHRVGYGFCADVVNTPDDSPSAMRASLCWLIMDGRRIPLQPGENILGRDALDGIAIESPSVSRRHARISVTTGPATIDDLGSKNGTYVRGERIATVVPLSDGDEVRVGVVVLRFRQPPEHRSTMTLVVDRRT